MEITIVVVLLVLGVVFILLELFLIPGLSLAGIAGVACLVASVYYAYAQIGATAGHVVLLSSLVLVAIGIWLFIRTKALERMSLKTEITGKNNPLEYVQIKVGDIGVTVSRLAPMGKIKINGHTIEAKSNGEFVDQGVEVQVLQIFNTNVLVGIIDNDSDR